MTEFDYEASIWGVGEAVTDWSHPTSIRLRHVLRSIASLQSGAVVVEVGAGAGQFIRAVKRLRPEFICHGSDISREALEKAKSLKDGVQYDLSIPDQLPYESNSIDAVMILDVVEHVENPSILLTEVRRILKPGALFYCFVPCEGDWLSLWHFLDTLGLKQNVTKRFAGHINYFSRNQLFQLYKKIGFECIRVRYSEHVLGQVLGIIAFKLMARAAARERTGQLNNETYFQKLDARGSSVVRLVKKIINILVYIESALFARIPSPNVHAFLKKL